MQAVTGRVDEVSPVPPARPAESAIRSERPPARESAPTAVQTPSSIPEPTFWGTRVEPAIPLADAARFLNRTSLFRAQWQYRRGKRSEEEWAEFAHRELEPLLERLLAESAREHVLEPAGVFGFFPANSDRDSIVIFDADGTTEVARFSFPRNRGFCLADFVVPIGERRRDVLAAFVTTVGARVSRREHELFEAGRYLDYLHLHGLAVELAEAAAEWMHARLRALLGLAQDDDPDPARIRKGHYRGCRFSFGYPACPDLSNQRALLDLLGADRIGVTLTETLQMVPEYSVAAVVLHHPGARVSP